MTIRCLIVGLGKIGLEYDLGRADDQCILTHSRAFSLHPKFELVAGVDSLARQQEKFREHYQLPVYESVEEASREQTVDLICISLPTENHLTGIEAALKYFSPKAILCEKPLAYDCMTGKLIVDSCRKAGVQLFVNYMRASDPGVRRIASMINSANGDYFKGVVLYTGGFLNNASHLFQLTESWLGNSINSDIINKGKSLGNGDWEIDVLVRFEMGDVLFFCVPFNSYSFIGINLLGKSGRLKYEDNYASWSNITVDPIYNGYACLDSQPEIIEVDSKRYQWYVVDELARAMDGNSTGICTGKQGYQTLMSMDLISRQSYDAC